MYLTPDLKRLSRGQRPLDAAEWREKLDLFFAKPASSMCLPHILLPSPHFHFTLTFTRLDERSRAHP